jgi:hypothetical protein
MAKFKDTLSALGHFWPSTKPDNKWPGRVYIDVFPCANLHCIGAAPGDGIRPTGRLTLHGLTEGNQCVTMLEATVGPGGYAFNSRSATQSIAATANYMLVASKHFDESASVRRVSFASSLAEHVLRLFASPDYKEIRHRRFGGSRYDIPILQKQVASYLDFERRIRVRVFRPTAPTTTIEPSSTWTIDFLRLVRPGEALRALHELRALLALICGDLIDLWDVQLLHKTGDEYTQSEIYFADPVEHPANSHRFPAVPILDIGRDRALFRRVMAAWLAEPSGRRIGRGAFTAILQDKGTLRFSHLRELKAALEEFAAKVPDSAGWRKTLEGRINQINYHDARVKIANFIAKLPQEFVSVPETFSNDVVALRNALVHDMTRLKTDDLYRLSFFLAKLKALYALSDAIALGARPDEVSEVSRFLAPAANMPTNFFTSDRSNTIYE